MDGSITDRHWCNTGGILSLVEFTDEHYKALECDLMRCGYELRDVGRSLSWAALRSFIENIGAESCTARDIDPELHQWSTTMKTNKILADIYDMLAVINSNIVAIGSRKSPKKPKFYPRPKDKGTKYGSDPVAPKKLREIFSKKRKKRHHG